MAKTQSTNNHRHPGGRPPKLNKSEFGQITCVLRLDTIERLKAGADSKHFGEFLQDHLDRYPPPSREQYLALKTGTTFYTEVKRGKKIPTLIAAGSLSKEARKLEKERARRAKLTPAELEWEESIRQSVLKAYDEKVPAPASLSKTS